MSEDVFSPEKVSELKTEFAAFDKEGNGVIRSSDLLPLLRCIGLNPCKSECDSYLTQHVSNGTVDFSTIMNLVQSLGWDRDEEIKTLISAFSEFDPEKTGTIPIDVIKSKLQSLGDDKLSGPELDQLIALVSTDGRNVNYTDLARALCA